MNWEQRIRDWKLVWALLLAFMLGAICGEAVPHLDPAVRAYRVANPTALGASGNVAYGVASWNIPSIVEWPENVVATTLAVPSVVLIRSGQKE